MTEDSKNRKRSVTIRGHRTSVTMENGFWDSLKEIAAEKNISVNQLIADVDAKDPKNLSSSLRLYILAYYKTR